MKATNGDTSLGGEDFDHAIVKWLVDEFKKSQGKDLIFTRKVGMPKEVFLLPKTKQKYSFGSW